jgi:hypothetical protein
VRHPTVLPGSETLEVVGESHYQDALWLLAGRPRGSTVRERIVAVLEPEPTNPFDPNAIRVLIDDMQVGHLSREDASEYLDALHELIRTSETGCVGLNGVIAGGGTRDGRPGFLGVFLDHDPARFGVEHHFVAKQGELRTGYSQARATDLEDDSYDLSWMDRLPADDWAAAAQLERLLIEERDPIDRHFMLGELSKRLYRCRDTHAEALDRFDTACRQHDAEMDSLRPVLYSKFGAVPMIAMYRQAVIRCQKSRDWEQMRWWAERGVEVYGDHAARAEDLLDLQKRVAYATAKLERPSRRAMRSSMPTATVSTNAIEIETLECVSCGRSFERHRVRGRKPKYCPDCQASLS